MYSMPYERLLLLLVFGSLVIGCSSVPADQVVTFALDVPPTNLDPRIGVDASSERLSQLIFSYLVQRDESSSVIPDLAQSWKIPDPQTYIFHLRNDVFFHDGRHLTSKDVAYTFSSLFDQSFLTPRRGAFELIEAIDTPDDYTVQFRLKEPFSPFLWNLVGMAIIPNGSGADFADNPVGSGPFIFAHYRQDSEILLRANDNYFGAKPKIKAARFKIVPEAVVRALELRKGTVDIALNVLPSDMINALSGDPSLEIMESEGTNYQYLAFNFNDPIFQDERIRHAIAHAIDRDAIIENIWLNQVRAANSVLPPSNWAYFAETRAYDYDPERSMELLEEAGYGNLSFTYRTSTDETGRLIAEILQQQFKEVGITMQIRSNEFATFFSDVIAGNFQMYSLRWIGGNNDPDIFNSIFHSAMIPSNGGRNRGYYSNKNVDRWIELARREGDIDERKEYYELIQRQIGEDLPYISLWYLNNLCIYNRRIKDLTLSPSGDYKFLTTIRVVNE